MMQIVKFIKRNKLIFFFGAIIVGVIYFGQKLLTTSDNSSTQQETVATVTKGNMVSGIFASGQIQTSNYLAVTTSVNGIVNKVLVKEGDKVTSGQALMEVTLDSAGESSRLSAYASYLKAKNSLDSAKNSLYSLDTTLIQKQDAFKTVKETTDYQTHEARSSYTIAENDYLKAKNDYNQQQSVISQLHISLNNAWVDYQAQSPTITAPTDGVIANIVAVEGTKIENSVSEKSIKTVASIKKEGTPIASLNINELDINKIKVGQKVLLNLNSITDMQFTGVVAGIDKIGAQQSGVSNYPIIVKFNNDSDKVLPNMGVDAEIVIDEKSDVLNVPTSAITTSNGKKMVTIINGTTTKDVDVVTGISDKDNTEIISGLNEGDQVLISTLPTQGFTTTQTQNQNRGFGGLGGFGGGTGAGAGRSVLR